jgi:hypothetical protein
LNQWDRTKAAGRYSSWGSSLLARLPWRPRPFAEASPCVGWGRITPDNVQLSEPTINAQAGGLWARGALHGKVGGDGSRLPTANELQGARYQGRKIAETAKQLRG